MIELFLSKPVWGDDKNADSAELTMPFYDKLEEIIWGLMTSEGRSEARLWLCEAISSLSSITPHEQRDLFMRLLRSKPDIAAQVFQMLFERRPQQAGMILAKKCRWLERTSITYLAMVFNLFCCG
ncbi:Vacuolar protein sorting-associated protein 35 [Bienertia sinuspersici]